MPKNAIDTYRDLKSAGAEPELAEAIAKAIVTNDNDHLATKNDMTRLVETKLNIVIALLVGLLIALFADKF